MGTLWDSQTCTGHLFGSTSESSYQELYLKRYQRREGKKHNVREKALGKLSLGIRL